jgi:hypothetical protein
MRLDFVRFLISRTIAVDSKKGDFVVSSAVCDPKQTGKGIMTGTRTFRCYMYFQRSTGMYVAECIDLDLMVKEKKANRAMRELRDAVVGHVRVAIEVGEPSLLYRPSPLSHRARYHFLRLTSELLKFTVAQGRIFPCSAPEFCPC